MPTATPRTQLKVNRPINTNLPRTANKRQIQRASNDLRVIPILFPQPPQLSQQQLKPKLKPQQKHNQLPNSKPKSQPTQQQKQLHDEVKRKQELAKQKKEAIQWLESLPDKF